MFEGLLERCWSAVACCGDRGSGSSSPERRVLVSVLLEAASSLTVEPADPTAESPPARQLGEEA